MSVRPKQMCEINTQKLKKWAKKFNVQVEANKGTLSLIHLLSSGTQQ